MLSSKTERTNLVQIYRKYICMEYRTQIVTEEYFFVVFYSRLKYFK